MASSVREVSASLDDIRKLQKRTRDKEYRLRKQMGSSAESKKLGAKHIAAASPRKPWAEVQAMTSQQRASYARRLNNFNKHASFIGSVSGDLIPKSYITQARKLMVAHNKFVERETKRIQGLAPDLWEQYRAKQRGLLAHEESIGGLLTTVDMSRYEQPRSLEVARRRVANFERRNKHSFDFYRKIQKRNMIKMLNTLGLYDLSELVRNMTADQFDIASSVMPVWENLSPEYVAEEHKGTEQYSNIRDYLYTAYRLGRKTKDGKPADEKVDLARLAKNRPRRETRGRMRAFDALAKQGVLTWK